MKKVISAVLSAVMLVCCLNTSAFAESTECGVGPSYGHDDFAITVSETGADGTVETVTYDLEDLDYAVYDSDGNMTYSSEDEEENILTRGYKLKSYTVESEDTFYWWPKKNKKGFKCGKGIAVSVSVKTDSKASKTIGLTSGDSSKSTAKNPSAILYTGTSGYWKFYMKNHSSDTVKVTGGSLSWGE